MSDQKYCVGIDLGTTNTVVAFFSKEDESPRIEVLPIRQVIEPGVVEERNNLPSFAYQPLETERAQADFDLPWHRGKWVSGTFARDRGAEVPTRFIASAKSWLCQSGVDRKESFLPFKSDDDLELLSPFQLTVQYLKHIAGAWDAKMGTPLGDQDVVLTVPASFDEEARQLTEEAAREAGLSDMTILEEPQAALYAWLAQEGEAWREEVDKGDVILVCDVGGGTSDFSLIKVEENGGQLELERTAVGEHILLGGDNMDLALAYRAKAKMEEKKKLTAWQLRSLWFKARKVKEDLLGGQQERATFTVLGTGLKSLIGGTIKAEFEADEALSFLVDGFFPQTELDDLPAANGSHGVQEMGLPYASDAAITKHLAKFLIKQSETEGFKWPNRILFNGGVFNCEGLRQRVLQVVDAWGSRVQASPLEALNYQSLDDAVAKGAAYYAWSKTGKGIRIRAGIPRSVYIEVASSMPAIPGMPSPKKALCIAPFGMEEGSEIKLEGETFALRTGAPASFSFLSSTVRQEDEAGTDLEDWSEDELDGKNSMEVTLEKVDGLDGAVPVQLGAKVTEVGSLELFFFHEPSGQKWKLEYQVRDENS
jgi:Ethanolamine utilization protein EutJ (predicted chaperonin)